VIQDQAHQLINELQDAKLENVISLVALHTLAVMVTAGCAILLLRTAAGTVKSRFLRHLAISVILNVVYRLGSIAYLLLKAELEFINGGKNPVDVRVAQFLPALNYTWHGIDIVISLLSSLFLFLAWDILRRYPEKEGTSRSLFTISTALFGSGSLLAVTMSLLALAEKVHAYLWIFLNIVDVTCAAAVLLLIGWQLHQSLGPCMKTSNRVLRLVLLGMTTFTYFIWGILQLFYYLLRNTSWYSIMLFMFGLSATIMTIILCSQALEEKP